MLWADHQSTNLGVRVLADGTTALARRAWGEVDVASQGYGPGDAPTRIGYWRGYPRRFVNRSDELVEWVRSFDVVIDTRAGDSFADIYGLERLLTMNLMHEVVRRADVPLVLGPQTVGPFHTRRGSMLGRRALRTAALTMARDAESADVARRLGGRDVVLTTDVVFCLDRPSRTDRFDVLFNVSGLLWQPNPHVDHAVYQETVRASIAALAATGRSVALFAHVLDSPVHDNDVPTVTRLADELGLEAIVPDDLAGARQAIAGARTLVGSRMHACLNALSVGVPAVPIAYSRKFRPLLDRVGWAHTLDLADPSETARRVTALANDAALDDTVHAVRTSAAADVEHAVRALQRLSA